MNRIIDGEILSVHNIFQQQKSSIIIIPQECMCARVSIFFFSIVNPVFHAGVKGVSE